MIPVMGIPYYNRPDLLQRCLRSIDCPVARLVIVDNSPGGLPDETLDMMVALPRELLPEIFLIRQPANAGVAASWNQIITGYPAAWWMLVNNDIQFAPGDLKRMADAANAEPRDGAATQGIGCWYANHGASFWIVSSLGIEVVGTFDENFYPAYCEDCDWSVRADLLKIQRVNVQGCSSVHGDGVLPGSCTVNANREMALNNVRTHGANNEMYRAKWGGEPNKEKFKTPFNNPAHPVNMWAFAPAFRSQQQW